MYINDNTMADIIRFLNKQQIKTFLKLVKKGSSTDIKYRQMLIDVLIYRIYVYDNNITIMFNIQNKKYEAKLLDINELECSFKGNNAQPKLVVKGLIEILALLLYEYNNKKEKGRVMKIGVDIDGVLTNYENWMLDSGSKYCFEKYGKCNYVLGGKNMMETFGCTPEEDADWWFNNFEEYLTTKARRYASDIIRKLKEEGNEIYIITARNDKTNNVDEVNDFYSMEEIKNMTKNWLDENDIIYDDIYFTGFDKDEMIRKLGIDIMIEDSVSNILDLANNDNLHLLCFDSGYNKSVEECKNITRVYSWYDIYEKIYKIEKENKKIIKLKS